MPRQNRVTPRSELVATSARGLFMGNRGCLHSGDGRIVRNHVGTRWIICELEFNGRRRQLMTPGQYTELFFMDEATALAAGHRPCAECRREYFAAFREAFAVGNVLPGTVRAGEIDRLLHEQRLATPIEVDIPIAAALPRGAFVATGGAAFIIGSDGLHRWSPAGYGAVEPWPSEGPVQVLTPPATVAALAAGYLPVLHPTLAKASST